MADQLPLHNKAGLIAWDGTQWVNVSTDSSGYLNVNLVGGSVSIAGADGAILDGASSAIKATVRDYLNSNPLAVVLTDTSGDAYVATGGVGSGGTEYTEDAPAAANPVGGMLIARRRDTLTAAEVSANDDNIAVNATAKGELYVKQTDAVATTVADGSNVNQGANADVAVTGDNSGTLSAKLRGINKILANVWDSVNTRLNVYIQNTSIPVTDNGSTLSIDDGAGSITVDGTFWQATQPVSVASLPLPSGAATEAKQPALGTAGTPSADVLTVQGVASMTALKVDGSGVTQPVSGSVAISAGTSLIGKVSGSNETSTVYDGTTALTPKFAKIAAGASGNNTLVAAVVGKKIRVLAYNFMSEGTVNVKFQSGAGGTDLTGSSYLVANTGKVAPYNPVGWFETASNTLLNLSLSGAINVGGELVYVEV
jgi:hypothetical protein